MRRLIGWSLRQAELPPKPHGAKLCSDPLESNQGLGPLESLRPLAQQLVGTDLGNISDGVRTAALPQRGCNTHTNHSTTSPVVLAILPKPRGPTGRCSILSSGSIPIISSTTILFTSSDTRPSSCGIDFELSATALRLVLLGAVLRYVAPASFAISSNDCHGFRSCDYQSQTVQSYVIWSFRDF